MRSRGRKCTACEPDKREKIDQERIDGRSIRDIAGRHDLSKSAVGRHARRHLPELLKKAAEAEHVANADGLLEQAQRLLTDARTIHEEAMGALEHRTALAAIKEQRGILALLGRLLGELGAGTSVHVHAHRHQHAAVELSPAAIEHLAMVGLDWVERRRTALESPADE